MSYARGTRLKTCAVGPGGLCHPLAHRHGGLWYREQHLKSESMGRPQTTTISVASYRDLDSVQTDWLELQAHGAARHVFQTIEWARAWWETLGARGQGGPRVPTEAESGITGGPGQGRPRVGVEAERRGGERPVILKVEDGGRVVGLVPMVETGSITTLLGDRDVCDYLDALALPGCEAGVAGALLDYFGTGQRSLELQPLRPDSVLQQHFIPQASSRGYSLQNETIDVSFDLSLPRSWEGYLKILKREDRHELRRKLRNLYASGKIEFHSRPPEHGDVDDFLRLFRDSREDKMAFMTPAREAFFRRLARDLGARGWLQLGFLELDGVRVATALCFDYNSTINLYNSGYDPDYAPLSAGLLCKAMTIKEAIDRGRGRYDFLRGGEDYKFHLGGKPFPIHRMSLRAPTCRDEAIS